MNATQAHRALEQRGYSPGQADLAMTRAMTHGRWDLSRHRVSYEAGTGEYRVIPVSWEGDGRLDRYGLLFTLKPGAMLTIEWSGERRTVICDRISEEGAVIRDLTEDEQLELDQQAYAEFEAQLRERP